MNKLNVLILGSNGFIGLELIKLLLNHSKINIKYLCGNSSIGKHLSSYDKYFKNFPLPKIKKFKKKYLKNIDIIFSALPNRGAQKLSKLIDSKVKLIDLSGDFRLLNSQIYKKWYKKKTSSTIKN